MQLHVVSSPNYLSCIALLEVAQIEFCQIYIDIYIYTQF